MKPKKTALIPNPIIVRSAQQIGNAIRRLRKLNSLSQVELASRSGVTQATVSRIEKGHQKTEVGTLLLLLTALDVDIVITDRKKQTALDSIEGLI